MLLAVDIGNSQTAVGLFEPSGLAGDWRVATRPELTSDELVIELNNLLKFSDFKPTQITGVCLASVVPPAGAALIKMCSDYLDAQVLEVNESVRTELKLDYDQPQDVGADRIANAVGGFSQGGGPLVIVDFGTAITLDAISADGVYLGGAIAPGLEVGARALVDAAARLHGVPLTAPKSFIGHKTEDSLRAGLVLGAASMVDGMIEGISGEMSGKPRVVATGGHVDIVVPHCRRIEAVEPLLTLIGLRKIWELNRGPLT